MRTVRVLVACVLVVVPSLGTSAEQVESEHREVGPVNSVPIPGIPPTGSSPATFQVLRVWKGRPDAVTPNSDGYIDSPGVRTVRLTFSADRGVVWVYLMGPDSTALPVHGRCVANENNQRLYDLDTFSGGRFTLTADGPNLKGELTIFGSGVHILSSEQGTVTLSDRP